MKEFILYPPVTYMLGVCTGMVLIAAAIKILDRKRVR